MGSSHAETQKKKYTISSPEEMNRFGEKLFLALKKERLLGFRGALGAGKTECIRGIVRSGAPMEAVSSPTFVLEHIYEVQSKFLPKALQPLKTIHHWDLYRLTPENANPELRDLFADPSKLLLIEWPEHSLWVMSKLDIEIKIEFLNETESSLSVRNVMLIDHFQEGFLSRFEALW